MMKCPMPSFIFVGRRGNNKRRYKLQQLFICTDMYMDMDIRISTS